MLSLPCRGRNSVVECHVANVVVVGSNPIARSRHPPRAEKTGRGPPPRLPLFLAHFFDGRVTPWPTTPPPPPRKTPPSRTRPPSPPRARASRPTTASSSRP